MKFYSHYKNGFLPESGGILDQAPEFLNAMETIDDERGKDDQATPSAREARKWR